VPIGVLGSSAVASFVAAKVVRTSFAKNIIVNDTARRKNKDAAINFILLNFSKALRKAITEPAKVIKYITKPDIKGAAAFIQGYVALLGLGITLIKNQIVEAIPIKRIANLVFLADLKKLVSLMSSNLLFTIKVYFFHNEIINMPTLTIIY
jgi:hypothetical protein